jgi:serine phosphatase RsbU (regulator of sigma subunit)
MNKLLLIITLTLLQITLYPQYNKNGYPFYTYYNSDDYNAYDQNWDVISDKDGIVYVANNNDGILQFDGVEWRKIEIENKPEIRALAMDSSGIIFVGCSKDFGYLSITTDGNLIFKSLLDRFDADSFSFSWIFKINIIHDTVFFSSDNYLLFKYIIPTDTVFVVNLPKYTLFTFNIFDKIYGSSYTTGLYTVEDDTIKIIQGGDFYKNKNIFSILPEDSSNFKIVTGHKGIYDYNLTTGISNQILADKSKKYLSNYISYSAVKKNNNTLLATLGSGIVALNDKMNITDVFDEQLEIKDHMCASVNFFYNSVWSALSLGILRFEYTNPFRYFSKESGLEGYMLDVIKLNNTLYVLTEIGLYHLSSDKNNLPSFIKIKGINSQITAMSKMTIDNIDYIFVGTTTGIYQVNVVNKTVSLVEDNLMGIKKLFKVKNNNNNNKETTSIYVVSLFAKTDDNELWVGSKARLICLKYYNKQWRVTDKIYNIEDNILNITSDSLNNIWAVTKQKGIIKVNNKTNSLTILDTASGVPVMHSLRLYNNNNNILCATPKGMYKYDYKTSTFVKNAALLKKYTDGSVAIGRFTTDINKNIYISYSAPDTKGVDKLKLDKKTGEYNIVNDFKRLGNVDINFFYPDSNLIWFGIGDVLYNYDNSKKINITSSYKCLIRKVEGVDTVFFNGTFYKETGRGIVPSCIQNEKQKPILEYAQNDITFHFAAPYFEGLEAIKYSYKLVGFKDTWSKWKKEPKAVFTNLNEGDYIFQVKAKNIYGVESEIGSYEFSIFPPWYRTTFAYIIYVILAIAIIILIVKIYTRRLEQEKIHLEGIVRERTAEIREQRDQIADQKQSIEDSILYASRIQRAILPASELAQEILPDYFILFRPRDIVSGDYFWMNKIGNKTIVVAADCTGHGVPGAFMSMLGVSFLNEIVLKEGIVEPHLILNKLRNRVKKTLKQEGKEGEAKDGMDVALVVFDETQKKLYFSGAYNPVLIYRGEELFEIKADRMPIGIYIKEKESFTLNEFDYQSGDTFYIFSDGYPDQFGGPKGQKFRIKTMKALLASIQDKPMNKQKEILNKTIEDWMAETEGQEQIDDMVIIGVKL